MCNPKDYNYQERLLLYSWLPDLPWFTVSSLRTGTLTYLILCRYGLAQCLTQQRPGTGCGTELILMQKARLPPVPVTLGLGYRDMLHNEAEARLLTLILCCHYRPGRPGRVPLSHGEKEFIIHTLE